MEYIFTIIFLVIILSLSIITHKNKNGKTIIDETKDEFTWNKDFLVSNKTVKFGLFNVKLYELEKDENGNIDENGKLFMSIAKILAKFIEVKIPDGIILNQDSKEFEQAYVEIMTLCTNFRFNVFTFKNQDVKLIDFENNKIKGITDHVDNIVTEIFYCLINNMTK